MRGKWKRTKFPQFQTQKVVIRTFISTTAGFHRYTPFQESGHTLTFALVVKPNPHNFSCWFFHQCGIRKSIHTWETTYQYKFRTTRSCGSIDHGSQKGDTNSRSQLIRTRCPSRRCMWKWHTCTRTKRILSYNHESAHLKAELKKGASMRTKRILGYNQIQIASVTAKLN